MIVYKGSNPFLDLAFERQTLKSPSNDLTLLISEWSSRVLVLGYAQSLKGINLKELRKNDIVVLRRCSGGSGVLSTNSLNISLFIPIFENAKLSIHKLYKNFLEVVNSSLMEIGIYSQISLQNEKVSSPLCFLSQSGETLLFKNKKFFGSAQARNKNVIMVHGTMLKEFDLLLHKKIFGIETKILSEKITAIDFKSEILKNKLIANFETFFNSPFCGKEQTITLSEGMIEESLSQKYLLKI